MCTRNKYIVKSKPPYTFIQCIFSIIISPTLPYNHPSESHETTIHIAIQKNVDNAAASRAIAEAERAGPSQAERGLHVFGRVVTYRDTPSP